MPGPITTLARRLGATIGAGVLAVAALAACTSSPTTTTSGPSSGALATAPPTTAPAPYASPWPVGADGAPTGWQSCTNDVKHFRISFPAGWHTASLGADDRCSLFDPASFTVTDGPALPTQQLWAFYQAESADHFFTDLFNPHFYTVSSQVRMSIGGQHAIQYLVTTKAATGPSGPTYAVGTLIYGYVIQGPAGRSLDVATFTAPGGTPTDFDPKRFIVDQAATTVHFS